MDHLYEGETQALTLLSASHSIYYQNKSSSIRYGRDEEHSVDSGKYIIHTWASICKHNAKLDNLVPELSHLSSNGNGQYELHILRFKFDVATQICPEQSPFIS
jgi:hypothetical protein